jgi:transcriptional regulator with XRE-family HTH domain
MAKKGYRRSDVAKAAEVSRQAVSLWFSGDGDFRNVHVANLLNLSAGLGIAPAELLQPLPGLEGPDEERRLYAEFCWDRSYPDVYRFLAALAEAQPRAVARLIESRGIYEAAAVVGVRVWRMYPALRQRLPAARRAVVDTVWKIHHDSTRR